MKIVPNQTLVNLMEYDYIFLQVVVLMLTLLQIHQNLQVNDLKQM